MAEAVMKDKSWRLAIDYINTNKATSTSEAVCNGIWNEILRRHFSYPKFIIAPEQRQDTGKRPDLTVFFVDTANDEWHPVFTFEGKAPYHIDKDSIIKNGITQAAGYVPSLSWSNHEEYYKKEILTRGMLACGKSFTILQYNVEEKNISEFMTGSLDKHAKEFDAFCSWLAALFK